eukprot:CAMPEP_0204177878 /NCGR_PEP_ID=MMETSP0361-20130328/48834_1 /ASSEMBLY_ACC=CAM_ASM_000343 /TAXON_ID=268821 /ORGANISM="Scrippsiella Hangoei, Strain SHTV-5" /LENGTH=115 /DNA_ID=CAMNT_0051136925 /DNA_START=231 /DNA_END=578 /DNA_ORIENTATION=-
MDVWVVGIMPTALRTRMPKHGRLGRGIVPAASKNIRAEIPEDVWARGTMSMLGRASRPQLSSLDVWAVETVKNALKRINAETRKHTSVASRFRLLGNRAPELTSEDPPCRPYRIG